MCVKYMYPPLDQTDQDSTKMFLHWLLQPRCQICYLDYKRGIFTQRNINKVSTNDCQQALASGFYSLVASHAYSKSQNFFSFFYVSIQNYGFHYDIFLYMCNILLFFLLSPTTLPYHLYPHFLVPYYLFGSLPFLPSYHIYSIIFFSSLLFLQTSSFS